MAAKNAFIVRESHGTYALEGPSGKPFEGFKREGEETRFTVTSPDGRLFAAGNSSVVNIYNTSDGSSAHVLRHKLLNAQFSRQGGYLIGWDNPNKNNDNFNIWKLTPSQSTPELVYSLKLSKPPSTYFSADEKIFARLSNNVIHFYDVPDFQHTVCKSPEALKIASFSLSPGSGPLHVFCFIPGTKSGEPSFGRLYRYPNFDAPVSAKSFFQADRAEVNWNAKGTGLLLTTTTEVDKSGASYYGKTTLQYLDLKGESATVQTEQNSHVIHASKWSPNSQEFCVISGKMPNARAQLCNSKCDVIFDMGIAARNEIYFNPQGNILLLCGFGNLPGSVEIWEVKKHKKMISSYRAANTTQLEWLNDGTHFLTATNAPRMNVDNGFKIWDFTGKNVFEWKAGKQLFGVTPFYTPEAVPFPEEKLDDYVQKLGNKASNIKVEEKKVGAYVPLHKRKGNEGNLVMKESQLSETEKKIRALKKKLDQITKLKESLAQGAKLEKNQLDKIETEKGLLAELQQLSVS